MTAATVVAATTQSSKHSDKDRQQFYMDILCTAFEGGIGYWCCVHGDVEHAKNWDNIVDYVALRDCRDDEDESEKFGDITLDTIKTGIERILSGAVGVRSDLIGQVATGNARNDAGEIDSEGADVIVQAGLLNDIVYG